MAERMPVLFSAHGNPMNALGGTPFADFLERLGRELPRPRAIVVVSAHWQAARLAVTAAEQPETIHDFHGFPPALFALRYPAPGAPALAEDVCARLLAAGFDARCDARRGLDHGAWAPLLFLYPAADVPVLQLALPLRGGLSGHVAIGRALAPLRDEGVLLMGSGNLTHNLASADLRARELPVAPWAREFDAWVAERLDAWDLDALARFEERQRHGRLAHPTSEHYEPLLVTCGAADGPHPPRVSHVFTGFEHATLSLRSVRFD